MSIFTTPLTLNDGTGDRIFNFQYQEPGVLVGRYIETAALASAVSLLRVSHTTAKSGTKRHLLQRVETCALVSPSESEPSEAPITVNITVNHHPKALAADVEEQLNIALAAAGITGFTAVFMAGNI